RAGDCDDPRALARKLGLLRDRLSGELGPLGGPPVADVAAAFRAFSERVSLVGHGYLRQLLRDGPVVVEGAQGILLDEWRRFHPEAPGAPTPFATARRLPAGAGAGAGGRGVPRCSLPRHGPGPFVTEDPTLELPEPHNGHGRWQGRFRAGHLDAVALRYAAEVSGGVDEIALTHLDIAARHRELRVCESYQADGERVERLAPGPARGLGEQERVTPLLPVA